MEIAPINRPTAHLMTSRRFAPLFWTQFLSAFNDNFLKNTLVFLILFKLAADQAASLVTLAGAIFMAPFLLLSALGGEIADRFDKALIAERLKFAEIAAAAVCRRRHRAVVDPRADGGAVDVRRHLGAVRADQIRHPARSSRTQGTAQGQRLDRGRPPSPPSSAAPSPAASSSADGIGVAVFGPMMMALAVGCWLVSRYIPPTGSTAPDLVDRQEHLPLDLAPGRANCAPTRASGAPA